MNVSTWSSQSSPLQPGLFSFLFNFFFFRPVRMLPICMKRGHLRGISDSFFIKIKYKNYPRVQNAAASDASLSCVARGAVQCLSFLSRRDPDCRMPLITLRLRSKDVRASLAGRQQRKERKKEAGNGVRRERKT